MCQALERQGRALQVGAPRVVRELTALQPALPTVGGPDLAFVGVLVIVWRIVVVPGERDEGRLALLDQVAGREVRALGAEPQVAGDPKRVLQPLTVRMRLVVSPP